PFDPGLTPAHGVFYRGWVNWLRGGLLKLQLPQERDPDQVRRFAADSAEIAEAFRDSATPYLEAYPGQAWPVDSTVAIASLRLHDSLLTPSFGDTVARWLDQVRRRLDPATGLIPHRVDAATGEALEGARGSSQALINRFLIDVDPAFAREQYLRFRDRFLAFPLGLGPAVREYPLGTDGPGDVDSGPLLLGVSLSATVVALGAAQAHGHLPLTARPRPRRARGPARPRRPPRRRLRAAAAGREPVGHRGRARRGPGARRPLARRGTRQLRRAGGPADRHPDDQAVRLRPAAH